MPSWAMGTGLPSLIVSPVTLITVYWKPGGRASQWMSAAPG